MKIGFFELEGWEEKIIRSQFPNEELFFSKEKIDSDNLPKVTNYDILSVFIDSVIDRKVFNNFPNLKFITTRSTGYEHINLSDCKEKGVLVSYVPGYADSTVAEYTFGLILNLTRKIYTGINQVKGKEFFSITDLRGIDLKGKTLGVIGVGRIGKEVIRLAKGFGMTVIATSPRIDKLLADEIGFTYLPLEDLLKKSDIITFHCPYNASTHHLINKNNIHFIKKGAFLINTARGGIVETEALVSALKDGTIQGAGLDVLEGEKDMKDELEFLSKETSSEEKLKTVLYDHILMRMPNVLITPHIAFNSQEALGRILYITIENINGFMKQKPINLAI
ncbi:MAG: hydroxyacid dehydrogenase [Candidatus Levybacteria bacterium]|nr:hydroxyacid dehydrogenase [Candidatus Levybacteria bacterium]